MRHHPPHAMCETDATGEAGMDRRDAEAMAVSLLAEFGVDRDGWRVAWNRRKSSYGLCRYDTKRLELSGPLVDVNDPKLIEDTIRHEIAHILAGPGGGHGPAWKEMCAVTGATPRACTAGNGVSPRWIGVCPVEGCDVRLERHRLSAAVRAGACPVCCRDAGGFDPRFGLRWLDTHTGEQLAPAGTPGPTASSITADDLPFDDVLSGASPLAARPLTRRRM